MRKGTNIKTWEDPWVLNGDSRFISSARFNGLNFVCNLIDFGTMDWDVNVVNKSFDEQDVNKAIMVVPLSEQLPDHCVAWGIHQRWILLRQNNIHGG